MRRFKYMVVIILTILLLSFGTITVFAENNSDLREVAGYKKDLFSIATGGDKTSVVDSTENKGVNVKSKGSGELFKLNFREKLNFRNLDASINLFNIVEMSNPSIIFNINDSETIDGIENSNYLSICFDIVSKTKFNTTLSLTKPDKTIVEQYSVKNCSFLADIYNETKDKNNMQFMLGIDKKYAYGVEGVADGSKVDFLAFKNNKIALSPEEDEIIPNNKTDSLYHKVMSIKEKECYINVSVIEKSLLEQDISLNIMQIGDYNFYDYFLVQSPKIQSEESVNYSKINIKWETKAYESFAHQGYILERYKKGNTNPEKVNTYKSKASSSYNDTFLKQNTTYIYSISAYANMTAPIKMLVLKYDDLEVTTKEGSIWPFLGGVLVAVLIFAGITAIYVNWYDITKKKKLKK